MSVELQLSTSEEELLLLVLLCSLLPVFLFFLGRVGTSVKDRAAHTHPMALQIHTGVAVAQSKIADSHRRDHGATSVWRSQIQHLFVFSLFLCRMHFRFGPDTCALQRVRVSGVVRTSVWTT
jgi:hypothetical protein